MSKTKQTTLFQSWGARPSSSPCQQQQRQPSSLKPTRTRPRKNDRVGGLPKKQVPGNSATAARPSDGVINLCDDSDNDEDLLAALEESLKYVDQGVNSACSSRNMDPGNVRNDYASAIAPRAAHSACQTLAGFSNSKNIDPDVNAAHGSKTTDSKNQINDGRLATRSLAASSLGWQRVANSADCNRWNQSTEEYLFSSSEMPDVSSVSATKIVHLPGFDSEAGRIWIYPTNYPVREYQLRIVQQALVRNTMVTLPTGLGKTFIAAVVMFNYYRWYPTSKIVFMAPTKPLVAQQIEACHGVMGIPVEDTAEMTGRLRHAYMQSSICCGQGCVKYVIADLSEVSD